MASRKRRERILRRARQAGLELPPQTLDGLDAYVSELAHWNSKINLTAFRLGDDMTDEAVDRLLIEPLIAERLMPASAAYLIDVGSGGGSPAVPITIARPALRLTMVEVKLRKSAFLRQLARKLPLPGTVVETVRIEELLARPELHGRFDVATVRAVRLEPSLWQVLQSLLGRVGLVMHFTSTSRVPDPPFPFLLRSTHPLGRHGSVLAISGNSQS